MVAPVLRCRASGPSQLAGSARATRVAGILAGGVRPAHPVTYAAYITVHSAKPIAKSSGERTSQSRSRANESVGNPTVVVDHGREETLLAKVNCRGCRVRAQTLVVAIAAL
jgi:hypothetical protein